MKTDEMKSYYSEILTDHNIRPGHKHEMTGATVELRGVNPSCGDDIVLKLKIEDGVVTDGAYVGEGCAISQASADIMLDLVIGKKLEEARRLHGIFQGMIRGTATDDEISELEEGEALRDISHMPARVKCAMLGWRTFDEATQNM
jgi:nitrogen fixation NifU-like protein